ncbi:hypothetical protein BHM03_00025365 [Ensete ventricosum]|nr:hypothetical protein BHM03_00025365 [Ensete ventricosum]
MLLPAEEQKPNPPFPAKDASLRCVEYGVKDSDKEKLQVSSFSGVSQCDRHLLLQPSSDLSLRAAWRCLWSRTPPPNVAIRDASCNEALENSLKHIGFHVVVGHT